MFAICSRGWPRLSAGGLGWLLALGAAGALAYFNLLFWGYTEWRVALTNDSGGYVGWYPLRTPGYTTFLRLVEWLSGSLHWTGVVQLNLLLLSYLALAYHFARLLGSWASGAALFLLLCGILPLVNLASHIMTEAVFASMICLHLAALCFYLRRRSLLAAAWVGATVFLICIVRPNGLPFAASLLLLAAMPAHPPPPRNLGFRRRWQTLASACLPIALGLLLSAWGNKVVYGAFALPATGGAIVAGYVGPLLRAGDGAGTEHEALLEELARLTKEQQARVAAAGWPEDLARVSASVTADLVFRVYQRRLVAHLGGRLPDKKAQFLRYKEASALASELAWHIVKAHPREYLRLVTATQYAWWRRSFLAYREDMPGASLGAYRYSRYRIGKESEFYAQHLDIGHYADAATLARHEARAEGGASQCLYAGSDVTCLARHEARAGGSTLPGRWWRLLSGQRAKVIIAVGLLSLLSVALLLTRHRQDTAVWFPAYLACLLQASVLLSAATHFYSARYAYPFTPLLFLFLVAMAAATPRRLPSRRR